MPGYVLILQALCVMLCTDLTNIVCHVMYLFNKNCMPGYVLILQALCVMLCTDLTNIVCHVMY